MQDTKNWNIHTLEPSIPKSTEKFLCVVFFLRIWQKAQKKKNNWETESLRCTELNSYRLTPTLSQSWSKNNNNNYNHSNLLPVDRLLFTGTRNRFQPLLRLRGSDGVKRISSVVSDSAWSVTVVHFVFFCHTREKHREGKAPKHECTDRKFLPRSALLQRAPPKRHQQKPLENVQIIPKIY